MKIYVDESGDLGFGPRASRYFVLAALVVRDEQKIRRCFKKIRQRNLKKSFRDLPEFKYNNTKGLIKNYRELTAALGEKPELHYEDIVITPDDDGSFDGKLHMGNTLKPYFGIGLGRTIPQNRVGFKFELGIVFQGKYALSSHNLNEAGHNWLNKMTEELDLPVSEKALNWWPMLNFSLTYRIR